MELREMCLQGFQRVLAEEPTPTAVSTGEKYYWQFMLRIREMITETVTPEIMNASVIIFFTTLLTAVLKSAAQFEGLDQIPCDLEKQLINNLLQYKVNLQIHEIFIRIFEKKFIAPLSFKSPVLDLGVGEGDASAFVLSDIETNIGSDPSIELVLRAKSYKKYDRYTAIDMTQIPFPNESFNAVFALNSFYHVENKKKALSEMGRILAPGGTLIFNDLTPHLRAMLPFPKILETLGLSKFKRYFEEYRFSKNGKSDVWIKPDELKEELRGCGFEVIELTPFYSPPLLNLGEFLQEFQNIFLMNPADVFKAPGNEALFKAWVDFLHSFIAPLIAKDEAFFREYDQSGYVMIKAIKKGTLSSKEAPNDFVCPQCKTQLLKGKDNYVCTACALDYPIFNDVPLLIPFYAEYTQPLRS